MYKNSDFSQDKYYQRPEFKKRLAKASKAGKTVLYNTIRLLNNCRQAQKENGHIYIQDIFIKYWSEFKVRYRKNLRDSVIENVEKAIACHNFEYGYRFFECPSCDNFHIQGFSCHSRFCTSCGKKYRDQRSIAISSKLLDAPHRHFIFSIPYQYREYFIRDRKMLPLIFTAVNHTFNFLVNGDKNGIAKKEQRTLGYISFIHTSGRDLKWNPHLHILMAERIINKDLHIKKFDFFPYEMLKLTFMNKLTSLMYSFIKKSYSKKQISDFFWLSVKVNAKYKKGYYIHGPKIANNTIATKNVANYIVRYASHPSISEERIVSLDSRTDMITWFYDPHEDDNIEDISLKKGRQFVTEHVFQFMKRLVIHIPEKFFHQIRFHGFYSNRSRKKITVRRLFSKPFLQKLLSNTAWINNLQASYGYNPLLCHCGSFMIFNYQLSYYPGGP